MTPALLRAVPMALLLGVAAGFSAASPKFADLQNIVNILVQASSLGILATGMTFVLLTAGIDLSVGSIMFLSAAIAGKIVLGGMPLGVALLAAVAVGAAVGATNAALISGLRMLPFIVTLAMLYVARGLALYITETRAMNLPEQLLRIGASRVLGIPMPVIVFAITVIVAQYVLRRTRFGRQVYAVGNNPEAARNAGIDVQALIVSVYMISGMCAAGAGLVAVAQLGAVSPTFGNQREFAAIAAAVLGGTSLFGGRGSVFPGAVLGAVLIQTVESGLVIINADPYLYPLVLAAIIFLAVLVDGIRQRQLEKLTRRKIRAVAA